MKTRDNTRVNNMIPAAYVAAQKCIDEMHEWQSEVPQEARSLWEATAGGLLKAHEMILEYWESDDWGMLDEPYRAFGIFHVLALAACALIKKYETRGALEVYGVALEHASFALHVAATKWWADDETEGEG